MTNTVFCPPGWQQRAGTIPSEPQQPQPGPVRVHLLPSFRRNLVWLSLTYRRPPLFPKSHVNRTQNSQELNCRLFSTKVRQNQMKAHTYQQSLTANCSHLETRDDSRLFGLRLSSGFPCWLWAVKARRISPHAAPSQGSCMLPSTLLAGTASPGQSVAEVPTAAGDLPIADTTFSARGQRSGRCFHWLILLFPVQMFLSAFS